MILEIKIQLRSFEVYINIRETRNAIDCDFEELIEFSFELNI